MGVRTVISTLGMAAVAAVAPDSNKKQSNDLDVVAQLDLDYQAAVKRNDADTMDKILHSNFVLILGDGRVVSRGELLDSARRRDVEYEIQDEDPGTQTVRLWGDTAIVTARLWIKGKSAGQSFERRLWFSDTYVRTPDGWRYAFAQASLPLPNGADARWAP